MDQLLETYREAGRIIKSIFEEVEKVIVGQRTVLEQILIAMLCNGHALIESYPGLGKTLTVSTLAKITDLKFSRIQCTPDLMPSDITGTYIVEEHDGKKVFRFEKGPIFANIVLADEINRASPKTQSAMLECMQERQVTVGNETHILDRPFFVLATQNPIEMEGTYPLPEAQLDRFLMKILIDYPAPNDEKAIIDRYTGNVLPAVKPVIKKETLIALQQLTREVPVSEDIKQYVLKIVTATRNAKQHHIEYGASPRASIGLILAAKARALTHGRNYVSREDIEATAYPVLRHRIILTFEAERRGITKDQVIAEILKQAR
ncbi:MAG: MoxR family ATPase [Methanocellales archaeon]